MCVQKRTHVGLPRGKSAREKLDGSYTGYVTDIIKEMDLNNKHIYMCCSRPVASSFKEALELKGFNLSKFSFESV